MQDGLDAVTEAQDAAARTAGTVNDEVSGHGQAMSGHAATATAIWRGSAPVSFTQAHDQWQSDLKLLQQEIEKLRNGSQLSAAHYTTADDDAARALGGAAGGLPFGGQTVTA